MDDLDKIAGGFAEENRGLPTAGMNIKCPKCGASSPSSFSKSALYDPSIGSVEYRCKCGCSFVCMNGHVIPKQDFTALCHKKGINYKF